jgi:hypothetical protein
MKKLDSFKENLTLNEVLTSFNGKRIFVDLTGNLKGGMISEHHAPLEVIVDAEEKNDVGFFFGNMCETSVSSESICKIIDKDAVKIIENNENYNVGLIIRFKTLEIANLF